LCTPLPLGPKPDTTSPFTGQAKRDAARAGAAGAGGGATATVRTGGCDCSGRRDGTGAGICATVAPPAEPDLVGVGVDAGGWDAARDGAGVGADATGGGDAAAGGDAVRAGAGAGAGLRMAGPGPAAGA